MPIVFPTHCCSSRNHKPLSPGVFLSRSQSLSSKSKSTETDLQLQCEHGLSALCQLMQDFDSQSPMLVTLECTNNDGLSGVLCKVIVMRVEPMTKSWWLSKKRDWPAMQAHTRVHFRLLLPDAWVSSGLCPQEELMPALKPPSLAAK